jgi:hypothetical protein
MPHNIRWLNLFAKREHAYGDGGRRIEIAKAQPFAGVIKNSDTITRGKLDWLHAFDGLREDPRVPATHGSVAILLKDNAASNFHSFVVTQNARCCECEPSGSGLSLVASKETRGSRTATLVPASG